MAQLSSASTATRGAITQTNINICGFCYLVFVDTPDESGQSQLITHIKSKMDHEGWDVQTGPKLENIVCNCGLLKEKTMKRCSEKLTVGEKELGELWRTKEKLPIKQSSDVDTGELDSAFWCNSCKGIYAKVFPTCI